MIGVRQLRSVIVDNAWNRDPQESEVSLASGKAALERLVDRFLASGRAIPTCDDAGLRMEEHRSVLRRTDHDR
jgi:hypothetical protein